MASTEFINLYEKLSKLHEDSADSNKYVNTAYAIFEYADEDSWDILWVGTDIDAAWDEWDRTCKWSDEYRGPNYPVYLVEYSEDQENPLTVTEFNELTALVKMSNADEDIIIDYYNMGYTIEEYRAEEESDEDDYWDEDDKATLIPRISVTIIPKNKKDMALLVKRTKEQYHKASTAEEIEMSVAGNWEYSEPIFKFDKEKDYYDFSNNRVTLYFVGDEIEYYYPSNAYSLEEAVRQDLDFDSLVRSAEVTDPDNIIESIAACLFKESIEEDFLDEFKCFEGSTYIIKYSVEPSDEEHSFQRGPFIVKEATITY